MSDKKFSWESVIRWALIAFAAASLALGAWDAQRHTNDFQWSPSRLMWEGVNPYAAYLAHDPRIIMDQAPNYGHFLYILLAPIALMPWGLAKVAWALTNLAMLAWCARAMWRAMATPAQQRMLLLTLALICIGYPIKLTLVNGQQALLCLLGLTLMAEGKDKPWLGGLGLAILVSKYSFGVPVGLAYLLMGRWRAVLVAAGLSVGAWLFMCAWTNSPLLETLLAPLTVASRDVPVGPFDLLSVFRILNKQDLLPMQWGAAVILATNAAFFIALWLRRERLWADPVGVHRAIGAACLMSLGTIYHLSYDMAVSLFPMAALLLLDPPGGRRFQLSLGLMFLAYWLLPRFLRFLPHDPRGDAWLVALMSAGLIAFAFTLLTRRALPSPEAGH
jgi:hypothetical protein